MKKLFLILSVCFTTQAFAVQHTVEIEQSALIPNARFKIEFDTTGWGGDVEAKVTVGQNGQLTAKNLPDNVSISGNKIMFDSGDKGLKEIEVQSLRRKVFKRGEQEIEVAKQNRMHPQMFYITGNEDKTFNLQSSNPENKRKSKAWGTSFTNFFANKKNAHKSKQKKSTQQKHQQTHHRQMMRMQESEEYAPPAPVMNNMVEARTYSKEERIARIRARRAHKQQLATEAAAKRIERKRSWLRQRKGI